MNMEEEGNVYTGVDTHTQDFTRKRQHKGTRGSYKRGRRMYCKYVCIFGCKHKCT